MPRSLRTSVKPGSAPPAGAVVDPAAVADRVAVVMVRAGVDPGAVAIVAPAPDRDAMGNSAVLMPAKVAPKRRAGAKRTANPIARHAAPGADAARAVARARRSEEHTSELQSR